MLPIVEIAKKMGLDPKAVSPYGKYKAKVALEAIRPADERGKMVLVTAVTPTRAGEGKTTTTVGLTQAMGRLGHRVTATLREPALGPIFGIKGGGTGGGKSWAVPEDEINVHFTGDAHAVASAHNLLAALTDNVSQRGQVPGFQPEGITWRRVIDMEDRALRTIITGLGGNNNAPVRETGFDIVTASEIMAILALASGVDDLRARLSRIVVGATSDGRPVSAEDVGAVGSMMSLLRHAIQPNLVQTQEGQPILIHTGPFGNIAHGCSSVLGDRMALGYSDYVLTEAGFGADLGFEKYMDIKARTNGLEPSAVVMVGHGQGAQVPRRSQVPRAGQARRVGGGPKGPRTSSTWWASCALSASRWSWPSTSFRPIRRPSLPSSRRGPRKLGPAAAVESRVFAEGGAGGVELAEAVIEAAGKRPRRGHVPVRAQRPRPGQGRRAGRENLLRRRRGLGRAGPGGPSGDSASRAGASCPSAWQRLTCPSLTTPGSSAARPATPSRYRRSVPRSAPDSYSPSPGTMMTLPGLPGSPRSLDVDGAGNIVGL